MTRLPQRLSSLARRLLSTWRSPSLPMRLAYLFAFSVSVGLWVSDRVPHHARIASALVTAVLWIAYGLLADRDERAREKLERQVATRDAVIRAQKAVIAEERDKFHRLMDSVRQEFHLHNEIQATQGEKITLLRREVWRLGGHHTLQTISAMHQSVQEEATTDEQF